MAALVKAFGENATRELTKRGGAVSKSSIGDIWLTDRRMFNPVNIKTSLVKPNGAGGSPNIVSLKKLTNAVFRREIDSYYLLLVHIVDARPPAARIHLVNLFQIMDDYVRFDSGHGQLMLNAKLFDKQRPKPSYKAMDVGVALAHLSQLRKDGNARLTANRRRDLKKMERALDDFNPEAPIDQKSLPLAALRQPSQRRATKPKTSRPRTRSSAP